MTDPTERPRHTSRTTFLVRAGSALVVVACIGLVAVVTLRMWPSDVADRRNTRATVLSEEDLERYGDIDAEAFADPVVLSFHDIAPSDGSVRSPLDITPERFDEHMAMLSAAGFTSITPEQLLGHLDGSSPLPPRSVLLTFDDSTKGVWVYGDRILERYGFQATMFAISGSIDESHPYYLTRGEVRAMRDTGRWSFGAHSHEGHHRVQVEPDGDANTPYLLALRWLADESRIETVEEWRRRVERDLDANIASLVELGLPRPELFSYPFSAVVSPTNEPALPEELAELLHARFEGVLANDADARPLTPGSELVPISADDPDLGYLPRFLLVGETTTDELFRRLVASTQVGAGAESDDGS